MKQLFLLSLSTLLISAGGLTAEVIPIKEGVVDSKYVAMRTKKGVPVMTKKGPVVTKAKKR